ncbi:GATA transcription factor 20 [Vitis vinifera]|uniref:GATA transcription factor 20 n=1 Tax=Vitis vinifera TaxID=29760 RepID=A0A438ELG0_VITVI|nr:GATA transcription factor 20 [Vitis vinifera]
MDSKLHLQDDEKDAGNDSCDPSLRLDTYDNGPFQPQPNPQQQPPISSHGSSQYFHPSFPQALNTFTGPKFLVPGYLDPINNCFIPSPTAPVLPSMNSYPVGGLGQNYHPYQHMDASSSDSTKRCAHCRSAYTPMWRRGPQGPRSLCNACGLRNRKEEERKKAEDRLNQPRN